MAYSACRRRSRSDRDAERIRNFVVAHSVDLTQHDRRPLVEREAAQRVLEAGSQLLLREHAVRPHLLAGPEFPVGRHMRVERHLVGPVTPTPEPVAVTRLIDDDAINTGPQSRLAPEPRERPKDAQKDLL